MSGAQPLPRTKVVPLDGGIIDQVLRDHAALRRGDTDSEIEAVRAAILIEDVFAVRLSDTDIDAAVLADASAVSALVTRLRRAD